MNKEEINEVYNYIKENPKCIIEYYDNQNFIMYKPSKTLIVSDNLEYDWGINDESDGYIPNIAFILLECAKKKIDISQIKIKSC